MTPNETTEPVTKSPAAESKTPPANVTQTSTPSSPTGFASLAKTIRSRTTDLAAVAIVIVGGMTLGSQMLQWWDTDDSALAPASAPPGNVSWGDGETPVTLEFGDSPLQLERQSVRGDRETVLNRLVDKCVSVAETTESVTTEIQPAERKLLGLLGRQEPVREQPGQWQVFRIERPLTLVIATRQIDSKVNSQPEHPSSRVVCWGMAQPSREDLWVLFTMRPTGQRLAQHPELGSIALPAGSQRIMSLRNATGGALIAFEGEGTAAEWKQWFDGWFVRHDWQARQQWTESTVGWSATFVPRQLNKAGRVDVSFSPAGESRLSGIVSVTQPVNVTEEGSLR